MKQRWIVILTLLLLAISHALVAQQQPNRQCATYKTTHTVQLPPNVLIIPGSIGLQNQTVPAQWYSALRNQLYLPDTLLAHLPDSITICYTTLPDFVTRKRQYRQLSRYDSGYYAQPDSNAYAIYYNDPMGATQREEILKTPGLQKSGAITRGISFGNRQSMFVNSNLNLQLSGKLSDDLTIKAAFTDRNVPFQPEGNTQSIQDFDQIYVQLDHKYAQLRAGDVVLQNGPGRFARYYKNVQGAEATLKINQKDNSHYGETKLGAALAKGKFNSQWINIDEGVQGPYQLTGAQGETFIIVLANSEKVFLDNQKLTRGFNKDYIIDYNTGQLTFNNNILITQFSRVRVDFEYAEMNYSRTILKGSHRQQLGKLGVYIDHYQEADNKNSPVINLDSTALNQLKQLGNGSGQSGIISGATAAEYSEDEVLYAQKDTLGDSIYVFSTNPSQQLYRVVFSEVGMGSGHYVLSQTIGTGRVYAFAGFGQGQYLPVRVVPLPNKKAITTVGLTYNLNPHTTLHTEAAFSQFDQNRFSGIDNENNNGTAFRVAINQKAKPIKLIGQNYKLNTQLGYEFLNQNFNPIDRFRDVEFDRDWNLQNDTTRSHDHWVFAGFSLQKNQHNALAYALHLRQKQKAALGQQHTIELKKSLGKLQTLTNAFAMRNQQPGRLAQWYRYSTTAQYNFNKWVPGYTYATDQNQILAGEARDSVVQTAMYFNSHTVFIKNGDSTQNSFDVSYNQRTDYLPNQGRIRPATESQTFRATGALKSTRKTNGQLTFTYRNLQHTGPNKQLPTEQTIMGRLDLNGQYFKRSIKSELTITAATGRELRRVYQFVRALNPGEGTHYWEDYNSNGLRELDEFIEASRPEDRLYIKMFVPTNTFVNAYANELNYRLNATAPQSWRNGGQLSQMASKFSGVLGYTVANKTTSENLWERFSPLAQPGTEVLVSTLQSVRSTLFFNRTNPGYGADLQLNQTKLRQLLNNGFEESAQKKYVLNTRYNLSQSISTELSLQATERQRNSDVLEASNYVFYGVGASPGGSYQPGVRYRISLNYNWQQRQSPTKTNPENNPTQATINTITLTGRYSKASKRNVQATVAYHHIDYTGPQTGPLVYEMLQALRPGQNLTYKLSWQQKILNGMRLQIQYEGRNSPNIPPVHLMQVQLSALF